MVGGREVRKTGPDDLVLRVGGGGVGKTRPDDLVSRTEEGEVGERPDQMTWYPGQRRERWG